MAETTGGEGKKIKRKLKEKYYFPPQNYHFMQRERPMGGS